MSRPVSDKAEQHGVPLQAGCSLSLRTRLVLLVAACVMPLFAFGFGNAYFDYQRERAEAGEQALTMARTLALLVQRDLEARLASLQVLALS